MGTREPPGSGRFAFAILPDISLLLVWEDGYGMVWLSWNSPAYLEQRHAIPAELLQNIAAVEALATKAAD